MLSPGKKFIRHCCIFLLFVLCQPSAVYAAEIPSPAPVSPETEINKPHVLFPWYGNIQNFGTPGLAQRWINVLGHVEPHTAVIALTYSLNQGPEQQLRLGPDSRRLSQPGDFNIDIEAEKLQPGTNIVRLSAQTNDGSLSQLDISINYRKQKWPLPYTVKWQSLTNIQEVVQVVDGLWLKTDRGIRTSPDGIGYDRSFAIGDADWSSFDVVFPVTIHRTDDEAFASSESVGPGFGLILHWPGHTDSPFNCGQPHCGWLPNGAQLWYFFKKNEPDGMNIISKPMPVQSIALPYDIVPGQTYLLRARVEKKPFRSQYSMKLWNQEESEPENWSLVRSADTKNLDHGGLLIVAHHVDMTVGNIEVNPLTKGQSQYARETNTIGSIIKEYFVPFSLLITLIAGIIIVWRTARQGSVFAYKSSTITCLALVGLLIIILAEPFFPDILITLPLNAKLAAALYIVMDLGRPVLQIVTWLMIALFLIQSKKNNRI